VLAASRASSPSVASAPLLDRSLRYLRLTWRDDALFPFSTRLVDGCLVHDFDDWRTRRYTVNSLLGLQAARAPEAPALVEEFVRRQLPHLTNAADLGLASLLLGDRVALDAAEPRTMQERCWLLWGAVATGREALAARLFRELVDRFVHPRSGLPHHSLQLHRRRIVSFGAVVYFLKALREYADATDDAGAARLFRRGVERMLELQGPQGEWPWMIDVASGRPLDVYPVFSVHQDAMAMLFLFPALDDGIPGVERSIRRSLAWSDGANELGRPLWQDEPPLLWRSIRRDEALRPQRRFARSLAWSLAGRSGSYAGAPAVINRECRSYHPGWILYVWSQRPDLAGLLA
jgi:hypothetical protein